MHLPDKKSVLVVCDPIWYSGTILPEEVVDELCLWQKKTGSIVFVDGSFQYMRWGGIHRELTSKLDYELTFRLICPTKALAIHGFRFSYLIMPQNYRDAIRYIFANTHGPTTAHNLRFAKCAMSLLTNGDSNRQLLRYIEKTYHKLVDMGYITTNIEPNSGYFMFAKLLIPEPKNIRHLVMDGVFFEQERYPDYVRINLLAPDVASLLDY
jgi:aspartate/methionine/tyrosine aminotransferase